jgi:inhibitor of cysteine peptidase
MRRDPQRVAALLLISISFGCPMSSATEPLRVDETADAREIVVRERQRLELSLRENPTTGFRWELQENGAPACALRDDTFIAPETGVGRGGVRRWIFEAIATGSCRIALAYRRAWESKPPERTVRFTVRVTP